MLKISKRNTTACGVEIQPTFEMNMVEESDIIPILCEKTDIGTIKNIDVARKNRQAIQRWSVRKRADIQKLFGLLECPVQNWMEYLLGLVAGEGSFLLTLKRGDSWSCGVQIQARFQMNMVEDSDILSLLGKKTGLGYVKNREDRPENRRDYQDWSILRQTDIQKLITMIEEQEDSLFWETDKGETFKEWKRGIELKEEGDTTDPELIKELITISKELNHGDRGRSKEDWFAIVDEAIAERNH